MRHVQGNAASQAQGWAAQGQAGALQPPISFRALIPNPFTIYGVLRENMASGQLQWSWIELLLQTAGLPGDFLCCAVTLGLELL